jgi:hypothetical protein
VLFKSAWLVVRRGKRRVPERCTLCKLFVGLDCTVSRSSICNTVSHCVCKELFVTLCKLFGGLDLTVSMSSICNTVSHCVYKELFVTLCKLFGGLDCTVSISSICNTVSHCGSKVLVMLVAFCLRRTVSNVEL